MASEPERPPHPRELLLQLIYGQYVSHALYAAAELGVPEHLAQGAATPTDIARALNCDEWMLTSVLRKLEMCGVLQDDDEGRFSLTRMGRYLLPGEPRSLWSSVMLNGRIGPKCSEGLLQSVRSGDTAFMHAFGVPFYDFLEQHPEFAAWFGETMVGA